MALKPKTPPELLHESSHETARTMDFTKTAASDVFARGEKFFDTVYGNKSASLMKVMDSCGTPDLGASARLMYSFFLGNTSVLSAKETMFVTFSGGIATDVRFLIFCSHLQISKIHVIVIMLTRLEGPRYCPKSHARRYQPRGDGTGSKCRSPASNIDM